MRRLTISALLAFCGMLSYAEASPVVPPPLEEEMVAAEARETSRLEELLEQVLQEVSAGIPIPEVEEKTVVAEVREVEMNSGTLEEGLYEVVVGPANIETNTYPAIVNLHREENGAWKQVSTTIKVVKGKDGDVRFQIAIEKDLQIEEDAFVAFDYGEGFGNLPLTNLVGKRVFTLSNVRVKKPSKTAYSALRAEYPGQPSKRPTFVRMAWRYGKVVALAAMMPGVPIWLALPSTVAKDATGFFRAKAQEKYNQAATLRRQIE